MTLVEPPGGWAAAIHKAKDDAARQAQSFDNLSPDKGHLAIYPEFADDGEPIVVRFGDGIVEPKGGGMGWVTKTRPWRRPLTVWMGAQEPYSLAVPLLFDRWATQKSVEADIRALEKWAGVNVPPPAKGGDEPEPPKLYLDAGGALQHDVKHAPQNRWVITDLAWGEAVRDSTTGERLRQAVTVTFTLYTADAALSRSGTGGKSGGGRRVRAKSGDTWNKIAARYLGHWGGAKLGGRLAAFNGQRAHGGVTLGPGQIVQLPPRNTLEQWSRGARRR